MPYTLPFGRRVMGARWMRAHRPQLETLEDRLPLGDALLGTWLTSWLVGPGLTPSDAGGLLPSSSAARLLVHPEAAAADPGLMSNDQPPLSSTATPRHAFVILEPLGAPDGAAVVRFAWPSGFEEVGAGPYRSQSLLQLTPFAGSSAPSAALTPTDAVPMAESLTPTQQPASGIRPGFPEALPVTANSSLQPEAGLEKQVVAASYGHLPLSFEANVGQSDGTVQFLARGPGYGLFLTGTGAVMVLSPATGGVSREAGLRGQGRGSFDPGVATSQAPLTVVRMQVLGGNPAAPVVGVDELPGKANYFLGNNPSQWHTGVPTFGEVDCQNIYPGIDLVYYGQQGQLEYDFRVAPGADPQAIHLAYSGVDQVTLDGQGNLVLSAGGQNLLQRKPVVYQEVNGSRQEIASAFVLPEPHRPMESTSSVPSKGTFPVDFVLGRYDASRPLIIDPVLSYSTYLGGSGNDYGNGIAMDPSTGEALVTGVTSSMDFPVANPWQPAYGGGLDDAFVTRISPDGSTLLYSTYLGGSNFDSGNAIAVDPSTGDGLVTGTTASTDFPTVNALQATKGGLYNAFVTRMSADGSNLVYSTYLGGSGIDQGEGISVDPTTGDPLVTGLTTSTNFPTVNPLQGTNGGGVADVFVARLSADGTGLVYSTYLGGRGDDEGYGIAVDPGTGDALVTGFTTSPDFPTANAWQPNPGGGEDAFVARLSADGSTLLYSTYLGGRGDDVGYGIAVDPSTGDALVTGQTASVDFPTANAVQPAYGGGGDGFVARLSADGSTLVFSTYLGGSGNDQAYGIAVDPATGDALVAGDTVSADFPTVNAVQPTYGGAEDAFVARISGDGSTLVYSSYLGGSGVDRAFAIAVNPTTGEALVTGVTGSPNFPTVNPLQPASGGGADAFVTKITF